MKVIKPSFVIESSINGDQVLKAIERVGRTCYKSEDKISDGSAQKFVAMLIKRGHHAMIEHVSLTVRFICDRGVSHELVRHRLASFAQESTRYCNYSGDVVFIKPYFFDENSAAYDEWSSAMMSAEEAYNTLVGRLGRKPEEARSVLPNSIKTEVVMTANLREWRHFFKLRCDKAAHPQMREVAVPLLLKMKEFIPVVFDDILYDENFA